MERHQVRSDETCWAIPGYLALKCHAEGSGALFYSKKTQRRKMIRIKKPWKAGNILNCWDEFSACGELIMRLNFAMHSPIMGHEKATYGLVPASATPVLLMKGLQLVRRVGYARFQAWVGFTNDFKTRFEGLSSQVVCLDGIAPYCCLCCTMFIPNVGICLKEQMNLWLGGSFSVSVHCLSSLYCLTVKTKNGVFLQRKASAWDFPGLSFNTKFPGQAKRMQWMEEQDSVMDDWIKVGTLSPPIFKHIFNTYFEILSKVGIFKS